ncbi:hypothetical protein KIW84_052341 [Lathyrus oleraceus]|uniref:Uncharacterized protein n=1 Tax=Pisum sativum TaxID=3888 RepID=A0A9D4WPP8_PEA|nr:hypothetical protein KIW84_052341 [Pisum sativum]
MQTGDVVLTFKLRRYMLASPKMITKEKEDFIEGNPGKPNGLCRGVSVRMIFDGDVDRSMTIPITYMLVQDRVEYHCRTSTDIQPNDIVQTELSSDDYDGSENATTFRKDTCTALVFFRSRQHTSIDFGNNRTDFKTLQIYETMQKGNRRTVDKDGDVVTSANLSDNSWRFYDNNNIFVRAIPFLF